MAYIWGLRRRSGLSRVQRTVIVRMVGIERVGDPVELAGERLVGIGDGPHLHGGAQLDAGHVLLVHVREHPERVRAADRVELRGGAARVHALHLHPGVDGPREDLPVDRGVELIGLGHGVDAGLAQQRRPSAGRAPSRPRTRRSCPPRPPAPRRRRRGARRAHAGASRRARAATSAALALFMSDTALPRSGERIVASAWPFLIVVAELRRDVDHAAGDGREDVGRPCSRPR